MTLRKKQNKKANPHKSSLLVVRALLMEEEQKRTKWTTATIFNYVLKLDLLPKCGLLTVSNKQLVIASMSSVRWSRMRRRDSGCKQNNTKQKNSFVYVRLINRRLRGGDKAGEDRGSSSQLHQVRQCQRSYLI